MPRPIGRGILNTRVSTLGGPKATAFEITAAAAPSSPAIAFSIALSKTVDCQPAFRVGKSTQQIL
jgi:hypothetical protein